MDEPIIIEIIETPVEPIVLEIYDGPRGDKGDKGDQGAPGVSTLWAGGPDPATLADAAEFRAAAELLSQAEIEALAAGYATVVHTHALADVVSLPAELAARPSSAGPRTANTITKWDSSGNLTNSGLLGDGSRIATALPVLIGGAGTPARPLEVFAVSGPQLRLTQDYGVDYCDFQVDSSGNLTLNCTGGSVALGNASLSSNSVSVGSGASTSSLGAVSVGFGAAASGGRSTCVGSQCSASSSAVSVGSESSAVADSVAIGRQAAALTANTMVVGSVSYPVNVLFGGRGAVTTGGASTFSLRGTGRSATNGTGGDITIDGGAGTGTGAGGTGRLRSPAAAASGTTPQSTWNDLLTWDRSGVAIASGTVPASATATGRAGQIAWDASYLYLCVGTNTWRRLAHSTW